MASDTHNFNGPGDGKTGTVTGKIGVLLVNLGTPEATSYWPMRAYLKEFLSDPRVVEANRAVWWFVLNGIILTFRPGKSGKNYEKIWNRQANESPLKTITRAQSEKLADACRDAGVDVMVDWAMRYGKPAIAPALTKMKDAGADRILIVPLYPQYSATTTASVFDKTAQAMAAIRWQPALRFAPPFYDHADYVAALAGSLKDHLGGLDFTPDKIIASYHGLPKDYIDKGDPYYRHCLATSAALAKTLGFDDDMLITTFQSRMGAKEWVRPYTEDTVGELARSGVRKLVVLTPAFISDCVETLEEIAIGVAETFKENGGQSFSCAPCLNDSGRSIEMLCGLVQRELKGWL